MDASELIWVRINHRGKLHVLVQMVTKTGRRNAAINTTTGKVRLQKGRGDAEGEGHRKGGEKGEGRRKGGREGDEKGEGRRKGGRDDDERGEGRKKGRDRDREGEG